jgi:hypothetical protein
MDAFAPLIAAQEAVSDWGFQILTFGLIGELLTLTLDHSDKKEKYLSAFFIVVVIVGCAVEHNADVKISALVSQEESAAAVEIAADNKAAQDAAQQAADLGVKVKELPTFVAQKKKEVTDQIDAFNSSLTEEKKQTSALIAEVNNDKIGLQQTLTEAKAAAKEAETQIAAERAANAPRTMTPEQQATFVEQAQQFSGFGANVLWFASSGQDADPLGGLLATLLKKAHWKAVPGVISVGSAKNVILCIGDKPTAKVTAAANALISALGSAGIKAFTNPMRADFPWSMETAGTPVEHPDMTILIGSKQ